MYIEIEPRVAIYLAMAIAIVLIVKAIFNSVKKGK